MSRITRLGCREIDAERLEARNHFGCKYEMGAMQNLAEEETREELQRGEKERDTMRKEKAKENSKV